MLSLVPLFPWSRSLRLIAVNVHFNLAAFNLPPSEHAGRIEAPGKLAVGGDGDHSPVPMNRRKLFVDDFICGLLAA